MRAQRRFASKTLAAIHSEKMLRIRAGTEAHRLISIWAVVVDRRVFVRSWSVGARGWYRTFLEEPRGAIQVGGREIPVRAVVTRSERVKNAVDRAYLEKYHYSRAIAALDSAFIRRHYDWYGGQEPPPLDHDGINDAFVEKVGAA